MGRLCAPESVTTAPYPGFPTDAQPVLMAALLRAEGTSTLRDSIFENRFRQIPELRRLGADIRLDRPRGRDPGRGAPARRDAARRPICAAAPR